MLSQNYALSCSNLTFLISVQFTAVDLITVKAIRDIFISNKRTYFVSTIPITLWMSELYVYRYKLCFNGQKLSLCVYTYSLVLYTFYRHADINIRYHDTYHLRCLDNKHGTRCLIICYKCETVTQRWTLDAIWHRTYSAENSQIVGIYLPNCLKYMYIYMFI